MHTRVEISTHNLIILSSIKCLFRKKAPPQKKSSEANNSFSGHPRVFCTVRFQRKAGQCVCQTTTNQGPYTSTAPALTFPSQKKTGPKSSRFLTGKQGSRRGSDPTRPSLAWVSTDLCTPAHYWFRQMDVWRPLTMPKGTGRAPPFRVLPPPALGGGLLPQPLPLNPISASHLGPSFSGHCHCSCHPPPPARMLFTTSSSYRTLLLLHTHHAASSHLGVSRHPCYLLFLWPHTFLSFQVLRPSSQ